jgi:hypothetical protein
MKEDRIKSNWTDWLTGEFDRIANFASPMWPIPDATEDWEKRLEERITAALYPRLNVTPEMKLTPERLGYFLGSTDVRAVWFRNIMNGDFGPEVKSEVTPEEEKAVLDWARQFELYFDGLRRFTKRALAMSVDQEYEVMRDFLKGFARGFSEMPFGHRGTGDRRDTDTYLLLLFFRPWLKVCPSVTELHELIVRVQGSIAAGDKSRTEKICQRLGLRFGKRGRPKGKRNSEKKV